MPELVEQMYCSQQIVIPPKFPYILKRYCKAAIKTQPYDILRWSFEYFKALAERRPPPVKLRLEYPVYSTEGGLTRGCLKVLANQLSGMSVLPIYTAKAAWQGFCLDPEEFKRILCLCEVHLRMEVVPFLHFIAVAGGTLTKSLTHTMILLCETLTKEPDGGSAAIPVQDFLSMYRFLARVNASQDVRYLNGYREGYEPVQEEVEEEHESEHPQDNSEIEILDDFWQDSVSDLQKLELINDHVARTARLSMRMTQPVLGKIERSPSMERAGEIDRINYMKEIKEKPKESADVNRKLRQMSEALLGSLDMLPKDIDALIKQEENVKQEKPEAPPEIVPVSEITIHVYDEDGKEVPFRFCGQPKEKVKINAIKARNDDNEVEGWGEFVEEMEEVEEPEEKIPEEQPEFKEKIKQYVKDCYQQREDRQEDLFAEIDDLNAIVDRYLSANYDLGMVAGRQMSTTSGEFIVAHIEKEIMAYINDQIAILPDPDLKKKKAKPEEVAMIRDLLESFLDENMDVIVPEVEQVEEEEEPIPDITIVYAVPGIGPPVDEETIAEFVEYAHEASRVQADVFMPRNIRHFMCPPLERYVEYNYEDVSGQKEEVTTGGGVITD